MSVPPILDTKYDLLTHTLTPDAVKKKVITQLFEWGFDNDVIHAKMTFIDFIAKRKVIE